MAKVTDDRARGFMTGLPHCKALNMEFARIEDGAAEVSMPYDDRFIDDLSSGVVHGGAVSALMDTCAGAAVVSHPAVNSPTATLNLRIDYMRPATPGQRITARAECYHVTRRIAFVRATATDDDIDKPVAMATGAFTVVQA